MRCSEEKIVKTRGDVLFMVCEASIAWMESVEEPIEPITEKHVFSELEEDITKPVKDSSYALPPQATIKEDVDFIVRVCGHIINDDDMVALAQQQDVVDAPVSFTPAGMFKCALLKMAAKKTAILNKLRSELFQRFQSATEETIFASTNRAEYDRLKSKYKDQGLQDAPRCPDFLKNVYTKLAWKKACALSARLLFSAVSYGTNMSVLGKNTQPLMQMVTPTSAEQRDQRALNRDTTRREEHESAEEEDLPELPPEVQAAIEAIANFLFENGRSEHDNSDDASASGAGVSAEVLAMCYQGGGGSLDEKVAALARREGRALDESSKRISAVARGLGCLPTACKLEIAMNDEKIKNSIVTTKFSAALRDWEDFILGIKAFGRFGSKRWNETMRQKIKCLGVELGVLVSCAVCCTGVRFTTRSRIAPTNDALVLFSGGIRIQCEAFRQAL